MSSISFDNPWLLFLLIPLFALVIVPFAITVRNDNANWHNITSCILHVIMCTSLVFALSGMTYRQVITETQVYVVADVSYSANSNLDKVDEYISAVEESLPKNSRMGVIAFGKNYRLLSDLGEKKRSVKTLFEGDGNAIDQSGTDIASAMRYAGNLFDEAVIKRIVLITDGAETVSANNTVKVITALKNDGVFIDAVYLNDNIRPDVKEIQIDGVEGTRSTYLNKAETLNVLVHSNNEKTTQGRISLLCNGEIVFENKAESFDKGLNVFTYSLDTAKEGEFDYTVRIASVDPGNDTSDENNVYYFTQTVHSETKVLFIGNSGMDLLAGRNIYGAGENVTFIDASRNRSDIPLTVEALCEYDEIAISNVDLSPNSGWGAGLAFLDCLETVVSDFGKTFTTYGNTYIQNTFSQEEPDETLTKLGDLLPVNIGNADTNERIVVILLDVSMSLGFGGKLEAAQESAIALLNLFGKNDDVMLVGFSGDRIIYLNPTKLKNRETIIKAIRETTVRNGTILSQAMQLAYDSMITGGYLNRELIIISDGIVADSTEASKCEALAKEMSDAGGNVIISAIGIQPSNDFLNNLVNNEKASGKGYYKSISNESEIDYVISSVTEEASEVRKEDDTWTTGFEVKINLKDEEVLNGVASLENVYGFWVSNKKPSATVVSSVIFNTDKVGTAEVPLYAYMKQGKGKVISVLTDIASQWTRGWGYNTGGAAMLGNIMLANLPDEHVATPIIIDTEVNGVDATLTVKTAGVYSESRLEVTVIAPDGTQTTHRNSMATEIFQPHFTVDQIGVYRVSVNYEYGANPDFDRYSDESETNVRYAYHYRDTATFEISYLPEYDAFTAYSIGNLYRFITGDTISEDGKVDLSIDKIEHTMFTYDFTVPLMIFSVILIITDIVIRKLRWKDIVTFFTRSGKKDSKQNKSI